MIVGVGIDVVDVARFMATLARVPRLRERLFTPAERDLPDASLAARFAAKEAFSKAIGLGMRMPMTWRACEVIKASSGQPHIRLHGALADWFAQRRLVAHVSVSDESEYAVAFVVVETEERTT